MPTTGFFHVELFAEDGGELGVCYFPVHANLLFGGIMRQISQDRNDASAAPARRARMCWVGSDGVSSFLCTGLWTRPEDFEATAHLEIAEALKHVSKKMRETAKLPYIQIGSGALSLMPDWGGAALWTAVGAHAVLTPGDIHPGCQKNATIWQKKIFSWQCHFESYVDESAEGQKTVGAPSFEWGDFMGSAGCLALSARSVLRLPVLVRNPWENRKGQNEVWFPDWEATGSATLDACRCLERLDEDGFTEALAQGAVQAIDAPMPWATYCAHMGLPRALAAILKVRPESALFLCRWGSSAWSAALTRQDLACLEALEHGGGSVPGGFCERWPVQLAWRRPESKKNEDALACLALLQRLSPMQSVPSFRGSSDTKGQRFESINSALTAAWEAEQIGKVSLLPSLQSEASTSRARGAL